MMKFKLFFILFPALLLSGCLSKSYPGQNEYLLTIKCPVKMRSERLSHKILKVGNTIIIPAFSDSNFVYRLNNINYLKDPYNKFFSPPAQQLNHIIVNYLSQTGLFHYVTDDDDYNQINYTLQAKVLELYADYRNSAMPKAVIKIQFVLFKQSNSKTNISINRIFSASVPLTRKDSPCLVEAWNTGLKKILHELVFNLRRLS